MDFYSVLFLVITANATPIIARYLLPFQHWETPLDFGKKLSDGFPVFGNSKTIRGISGAILGTILVGSILDFTILTSFLIATLAMVGDLCSSFVKRRMGMPSGKMIPFLDQIPESFLPLFFIYKTSEMEFSLVIVGVMIFIIVDISLSLLLKYLQQHMSN